MRPPNDQPGATDKILTAKDLQKAVDEQKKLTQQLNAAEKRKAAASFSVVVVIPNVSTSFPSRIAVEYAMNVFSGPVDMYVVFQHSSFC